METNCPKCNSSLTEANIDVGNAIANCPKCLYSFHFSKGGKPRTKEVKQSWKIKTKQKSSEIVVERIWFGFLIIVPLFLHTLPTTLLAYFATAFVITPQTFILIRFIALVIVLLWLRTTYFSLCLLFNRTRFHISSNEMRISHFPFPWRRSGLKIERIKIEQIFVKERNESGLGNISGPTFYECLVKTQTGENIVIESNLSFNEARTLEFELEKALGIQDSAIKGEFIPNDFLSMLKSITKSK